MNAEGATLGTRMVVESLAVLLVVFASPPPETVTVGTSGVLALDATLTVNFNALFVPVNATSDPANVAVGGVRLVCVQPVPVKAVAVNPAGSDMVAVMVPTVGPALMLLTVTVYWSPVSPCVELPT